MREPCDPDKTCDFCPRLFDFRRDNIQIFPDWHNAPVPSFGDATAKFLIVGLAPGLKGANRTGRPFTGDYAGDLLYATLLEAGFAEGTYGARPDDGLRLIDCRITNAVRCVPPQNKPTPAEIARCLAFLKATVDAMPNLVAILALGRIAHDAVIRAFGQKLSAHRFLHGSRHRVSPEVTLFDSYHCSRYNTNTGVLTEAMFRAVMLDVRHHLQGG